MPRLTPEERSVLKQRIDQARRNLTTELRNEETVEVTVPLLKALYFLSDDQREAWIDRRIVGRTLQAIATDMGCTKQWVRDLERQAERLLTFLVPRPHTA